tara:strand:- start:22192 stop:23121 length:930 start_codon:yes stop_codon:yes gene_type:complete
MRKHILNILLTTTLAFSTTDASAAAAEPEHSIAQSRLSQSRYNELVIENADNAIKIRGILDELPLAIDERSISAALSGDYQQLNDLAEYFPTLAAFLGHLNNASDVLDKFHRELADAEESKTLAEQLQRGEEEKAARIKAQEEADAAMAARLAAGEKLEDADVGLPEPAAAAAAASAPAEKALPDQEEGYVGFEQSPTSAAAAAAAPAESEDDDSVASEYEGRPTHWRSDRHAAEMRRVDNERTAEADEIFAKGFAAAEAARIKEQEEADAAAARAFHTQEQEAEAARIKEQEEADAAMAKALQDAPDA